MLVSELKKLNTLPRKFLDVLPEVCQGITDYNGNTLLDCGHKIGISESLSKMYCTNNRCPNDIAFRLFKLCSKIGLEFVNMDLAKQFVAEWGITNPLQIFMYESSDGNFTSEVTEEESEEIDDILDKNRDMTLERYFELFGVKEINLVVSSLCNNFDTLNDFYEELESKGILFVNERLDKCSSKLNSEIIEYATRLNEQIINGNFELLEDFANRAGVENKTLLIRGILDGGCEYITQELNRGKCEDYSVVSILSFSVFQKLIMYKSDFFECIDYVRIIKV